MCVHSSMSARLSPTTKILGHVNTPSKYSCQFSAVRVINGTHDNCTRVSTNYPEVSVFGFGMRTSLNSHIFQHSLVLIIFERHLCKLYVRVRRTYHNGNVIERHISPYHRELIGSIHLRHTFRENRKIALVQSQYHVH